MTKQDVIFQIKPFSDQRLLIQPLINSTCFSFVGLDRPLVMSFSEQEKNTFHSSPHFVQFVPGFVLLCHLCGIFFLLFSGVWLQLKQNCVCVITVSLSCWAAVLASGLFIVTARLAVTANGEAQFVLVYSKGVCLELGRAEDLMRSSRRARPTVCIGRNNLPRKVASAETCGLFLNRGQEPGAFGAHNWSNAHNARTHTRFQYKHEHCENTSGVRE